MGIFDAALLAAAIGLSTPLLLAAVGELISERAGVLNIGLEGMMLAGAFCAYAVADAAGRGAGVAAGAAAGVLLAAVVALLCVTLRAEQIVVGIALNLVALGGTTYAFEALYSDQGQVVVPRVGDIAIPVLRDLPVVGEALFEQQILTYLAFAAVPACWWLLYRTNWGLALRATGEAPAAADTSGLSVARTRWLGTLAAGLGAGLAGAFLAIAQTGLFTDGMTAGRGYLAVAAVIFARWSPTGLVAACLLFGGADALQLRLQAAGTVPVEVWIALAALALGAAVMALRAVVRPALVGAFVAVAAGCVGLAIAEPSLDLPSQLWLSVPYVCALVALAGVVGHARMPAALTVPYRRAAR